LAEILKIFLSETTKSIEFGRTDRRTDAYPWQKLTWPTARWAKKQANQKQELPVAAMFVNGSERHKQSQQRTW
jgi:hypothetical protein